MKQIGSIALICMIFLYMIGCNGNGVNSNVVEQAVQQKEKTTTSISEDTSKLTKIVEYNEFFDGIDGCAVFYNNDTKEYQLYNEETCEKQFSPCSTFKIISTLVGLEKGVITSADSKMDYNGRSYSIKSWNEDLNLKEAFQASCVWYFRQVIDKIGRTDMEKEIKKIAYGNCDISEWEGGNINSSPELNGFWLESSLKISPKEQVEVISNIFNGKTNYSMKNIEILKNIMLVEKNERISIYGKTGTGNKGNAWFVGMVEKGAEKYFFAIHLNDEKNNDISGVKAKEIAIKIINKYYDKI